MIETPSDLISVIIPAYNAADTLPHCLAALQQQTIPPTQYEVIVVDDGSADDTAQIAAQFPIRVIRQRNAGAAAARNHGAEVARGWLLLFTDADCIPAPDWIAQMCKPFQHDETVVGANDVVGAKGVYGTRQVGLIPRFVQQEYQDKYDAMAQLEQIDFVDTYAAAYRRDFFLALGGFDTRYPGASVEDQEFSFRAAKAAAQHGQRLIFIPTALVWHRHDQSVGDYVRRKYGIGYWKAFLLQRHPDKAIQDSHTPQLLKGQMGLAALGGGLLGLSLLLPQRNLSKVGFGIWGLLLLSGWPFYRKLAQRDPAVVMVAPWLLFVRAWALGLGLVMGYLRLLWPDR